MEQISHEWGWHLLRPSQSTLFASKGIFTPLSIFLKEGRCGAVAGVTASALLREISLNTVVSCGLINNPLYSV